jgi:hypothetical protein
MFLFMLKSPLAIQPQNNEKLKILNSRFTHLYFYFAASSLYLGGATSHVGVA